MADESDWVTSLSVALAHMPDLWNRLLYLHVADCSSGRCRACTRAGTGIPGAQWPCAIHIVARKAELRARSATAI